MCRVDLHVHTRRHSACAEFLDPQELGAAMSEAHLDAVLLAEHDAQWDSEELEALRRTCHPRHVFSGIELSARDGHVVAFGMAGDVRVDKKRTVDETTRLVAQLGGFSILVHPFQSRSSWGDSVPHELGAVEVASTVTIGVMVDASCALASQWRVPAVAGSDAHALDRVGYCWTWLPHLPQSEVELGRLLSAGLGTAGGGELDRRRP